MGKPERSGISVKGLMEVFRGGKSLEKVAIVLLVIAIVAIILWPTGAPGSSTTLPQATQQVEIQANDPRQTEERLKNVLSSIRGAGEVEVMISYETERQGEDIQSGAIRGVIVVAQGAEDLRVYSDLLGAVSTVLHIPVERVEIFVMRTGIDE